MSAPVKALAYLRVSTREQADSGLGLDSQRRAINEEAERRGWDVRFIADEGFTARNLNRPGYQEAMRALKRHEADVLVVAKLDRLSRSMVDFAGILGTAARQGWSLVTLDFGVDMTTPAGEFMAHVVAAGAHYERRLISARTRDAMAEAKARGYSGNPPGRRRSEVWQPELVARVLAEREEGASYKAIAAGLDRDGIAPPGGGKRWYPSTVQRLVLVELPEEVA